MLWSLLVCSKDIIAVDSVASYAIGIDPDDVRLIELGHEEGMGESDIDKIQVTGEDLEKNRTRFELPEEAMARRFPDLKSCGRELAARVWQISWTPWVGLEVEGSLTQSSWDRMLRILMMRL